MAAACVDAHGSALAMMIESDRYPQSGLVSICGLLPRRHYVLTGAAHRFCRADASGTAWIALQLRVPALLTVAPVI